MTALKKKHATVLFIFIVTFISRSQIPRKGIPRKNVHHQIKSESLEMTGIYFFGSPEFE
jgi:hypothetical protein